MKLPSRRIRCISAVLLLAGSGPSVQAQALAATAADGPRFRNERQPVSLQRGQQLYVEHCALCHGISGRGDGPRSAYFNPDAQFIPDFSAKGYLAGRDAQVLNSIREGLKRLPEPAIVMPQFRYILSDSEIRSVLAYVHTLARAPGPAIERVAVANDGEALARRHNCFACHQPGAKLVGPAYRDVAGRYRSQAGAVELLAEKIRTGSTGAWGNLAMPPMATVPDVDRKRLAEWILKTE